MDSFEELVDWAQKYKHTPVFEIPLLVLILIGLIAVGCVVCVIEYISHQ